MGINMIAISAILGSGIIGILFMKPVIRDGAARTVDHPSKPVRYFYRYASFGLCFLLSFMVSPALFLQFLPLVDLRDSPEYVQSAAVLSYPLPFAIFLYWMLVKLARWSTRRGETLALARTNRQKNPVGEPLGVKNQDLLLEEMEDITGKMERGEIPLAQAEERMMTLLARQERDTRQRLEALKQASAATRRRMSLGLLLVALAVGAVVVFALSRTP